MSGVEAIVGLALGAFPLTISAMEHYRDTKKAAGTFLGIRKAYRKDVTAVRFCQTMYTLHVEELLQPLVSIEIDGDIDRCAELLAHPGGPLWKKDEVEKALSARLRNNYRLYLDTMEELQRLMIKLAQEVKVDDQQFQRLLAQQPSSLPHSQLMQKANRIILDSAFQARRFKYSLSSGSREELLKEVETYIGKLGKLLAAVDRLSKAEPEIRASRGQPIPRFMQNYWRHAERIYKLMWRSMSCSCRSLHSAKLWLSYQADTQAQLNLLLLFSNELSQTSLWREEGLRVRHDPDYIDTKSPKSSNIPTLAIKPVSGPGTRDHTKNKTVSFSASNSSPANQLDLITEGICRALKKRSPTCVCLGALTDEDEQVQYLVYPEQLMHTASTDAVSALDLLSSPGRVEPPFYRNVRCSVAFKIVSNYVKYHLTPWVRNSWSLSNIRFLKRPPSEGGIDYSVPFVVSNFEYDPTSPISSGNRDHSLWALGILLLELCFGRTLESHSLFADPDFARNPQDPLQRQIVAQTWAQDVELEADADYACAVNWCLQQPPTYVNDIAWRKTMAQNVIQPLQICSSMANGAIK